MPSVIYVTNASEHALALTNTVQPTLDRDAWKPGANAVADEQSAVQVMEFNRDTGITQGHCWTFTTAFVLDGVEVSLQERVEGTLLGSEMSQAITAGQASTGFLDSDAQQSLYFVGVSGAQYQIYWQLSGLGYKDITYHVVQVEPGYRPIDKVMTQIDTVVFLMLENRSLDNVLGWLYRKQLPNVVVPADSNPAFDGLGEKASNPVGDNTSYAPTRGTSSYGTQTCRVPLADPHEPLPDVKQQLYGDGAGNTPPNPWSTTPKMQGFAENYACLAPVSPAEIMGAYTAQQLPVLYGLAENFAISDRWFASVPTQTFPNRAFSVCGTSLGAEVNSDFNRHLFADANTVFNALGDNGKSWGLFWQSVDPLGSGTGNFTPFTPNYFTKMNSAPNGGVFDFEKFKQWLVAGELPNFCYIEPSWGGGLGTKLGFVGLQGNDYHPPAWIGPAEYDLNALYESLVNCPQWKNMLFIITFDEHGGTWDHVSPPVATPPDADVGASGFRFDRLGVRIPTILVSPFLRAGTVFRAPTGSKADFDHTSVVATLLKWAGVEPASAGMGARVAVAPTFESVLTSSASTAAPPRFVVPPEYREQAGGTGALVHIPTQDFAIEAPMDPHDFHAALSEAKTPDELMARLKTLTRSNED